MRRTHHKDVAKFTSPNPEKLRKRLAKGCNDFPFSILEEEELGYETGTWENYWTLLCINISYLLFDSDGIGSVLFAIYDFMKNAKKIMHCETNRPIISERKYDIT